MTERIYGAFSLAGGEESPLTLEHARRQVKAWEEKGYHSYVGKLDDPSWEDTGDAPEAPSAVDLAATFSDRDAGIQFARELLEALDCEIKYEDRYFVVYDELEEL